jgi:hypothetical protein
VNWNIKTMKTPIMLWRVFRHPVWAFFAGTFFMFVALFRTEAVPNACDIQLHLAQAHDFFLAIIDDPGYPDWNARHAGEAGAPTFRYTAPIPLLLTAIFQLLGVSSETALKLVPLFYAIAGAIGLYTWFKLHRLPAAGFAVFAFLTSPFLAIHTRFLFFFQNICAVLLTPWLFACHEEYRQSRCRKAIGKAMLIFGIVTLTHLQSSIMLSLVLAVACLTEALIKSSIASLKFFLLTVLTGSMIAAPYLLPVIMTRNLIRIAQMQSIMSADTGSYFSGSPALYHQFTDVKGQPAGSAKILTDLLQRSISNNPVSGAVPWSSLRPWLFFSVVLFLFSAIIGFLLQPARKELLPHLLAGIAATAISFSPSGLFAFIPGSEAIQFPWRFAFPASIILLPAICGLINSKGRLRVFLLLPALTTVFSLLLVTAASYCRPGYREHRIAHEFLPVTVTSQLPDHALPLEKDMPFHQLIIGRASESTNAPASFSVEVESGFSHADYSFTPLAQATEFAVMTHFDPFWRMKSGDIDISLSPAGGLIKGVLPAGSTAASLYRVLPHGRQTGWYIGVLALLAALWHLRKNEEKTGK